jgi:hypothetical protein
MRLFKYTPFIVLAIASHSLMAMQPQMTRAEKLAQNKANAERAKAAAQASSTAMATTTAMAPAADIFTQSQAPAKPPRRNQEQLTKIKDEATKRRIANVKATTEEDTTIAAGGKPTQSATQYETTEGSMSELPLTQEAANARLLEAEKALVNPLADQAVVKYQMAYENKKDEWSRIESFVQDAQEKLSSLAAQDAAWKTKPQGKNDTRNQADVEKFLTRNRETIQRMITAKYEEIQKQFAQTISFTTDQSCMDLCKTAAEALNAIQNQVLESAADTSKVFKADAGRHAQFLADAVIRKFKAFAFEGGLGFDKCGIRAGNKEKALAEQILTYKVSSLKIFSKEELQ